MITHIKGDLFETDCPVIAHGCNLKGIMGAGVAKIVKDRYIQAFHVYEHYCQTRQFYIGSVLPVRDNDRIIVNLGTQTAPGPCATAWNIFLATANMLEWATYNGVEQIAMPRIGAGLGGLHWHDVSEALETAVYYGSGKVELQVYYL